MSLIFRERRIESELHSFSSVSGDFQLEIIPLIDDSEMEETSGESLLDRDHYRDSSEALFQEKPDSCENLVEKPMSPPVLTKAEIEVAREMRERVNSFVKTYKGVTNQEPHDNVIAHHFECQGQSDDVSLINLNDHYKAGVFSCKGF